MVQRSLPAVTRASRGTHSRPSPGNGVGSGRAAMDYRILGPLEALDGERRLPLGGARQRAVLALLLLHGNETLTRDVIIDQLWGEEPPNTAAKVLQNCISALRKELPAGTDTLRTVSGAYSLALGPDELDRDRFE